MPSGDLTTRLQRIAQEAFGWDRLRPGQLETMSAVMQGRDTLIYPSLLFGAHGAVPASANVAPAVCVEIFEAFDRGDHAAALAAQLRLNPIRLSLNLGTAPGSVKAALDLLDMSIGPAARKPRSQTLSESEIRRISSGITAAKETSMF